MVEKLGLRMLHHMLRFAGMARFDVALGLPI